MISPLLSARRRLIHTPGDGAVGIPRATALRSWSQRGFDHGAGQCRGWSHDHSAATDGWHNRDLSSRRYGSCKSTCVSEVFISYEDVNVLPDLSLFRHDTIPNAWTCNPQRLQGVSQRGRRRFKLHLAVAVGKGTQRTRYVKRDGHHLLGIGVRSQESGARIASGRGCGQVASADCLRRACYLLLPAWGLVLLNLLF